MIFENLLQVAGSVPRTSGLRHGGAFHAYEELAGRVERLAAGFASRGVGRGDVLLILLPNSPQLFVVAHALFAIGAVAMPLGVTATAQELAQAARKARIFGLVARAELADTAAAVAAQAGGAGALPVFLAGGAGDWSIETLERTAPARLPMLAGDTAALYLLSSGTTGLPKIVPHTHAELLADGRRTSTAWGLAPDDIVFDMLPGNFAMGLLLGLTNALEAGATTVYWSDPRPLVLARRALLEALIAEKVTVMGAVPAMYDALAGTPGDSRPATIRLAFSGGAALRRATYDAMRERFGIRLRQSYGSTEAIFVAHNDAPDVDRLWDSVGRPVGDAEVRLAPTDAAFGPGVGELLIRSSSVTSGYLDDPEANGATFFEDGWLRSGDLARIDPVGNLFIVGRSKLLIEISGFKIDPIEVEETLRLHPAVAEAVVVGARRSPRAEAQLKAFVVRQDDVSADSLIRFVRERLSAQKVPAAIEFVETLPRSSAGKILRSKLGEGV